MNVTRVTFKNEIADHDPAGPVVLWDQPACDADPVMVAHRAAGRPGRPYNYRPAGMLELGWLPRSAALAIAGHFDLDLTES